MSPSLAGEEYARLAAEYPTRSALHHDNPFQLLVATILSAQTTDERVNKVTPALFARYPTPADLAAADPAEVEALIHPTGFFRNKARACWAWPAPSWSATAARSRRDGGPRHPPRRRAARRPTWSAASALGLPGLPVDTHVGRLSRRLGLTTETDPVKVEHELNAMSRRASGACSASG